MYEGLRSAQQVTEADLKPKPVEKEEIHKAEEKAKKVEEDEELADIQDGINVGSNLEELDWVMKCDWHRKRLLWVANRNTI